ncbi:MAG: nuclear transport factor 2 family protein [Gammaproteobacteria bacterium]|nr:nuclear transport factor 2 family protein [Gammaproteobacteria bacterium]
MVESARVDQTVRPPAWVVDLFTTIDAQDPTAFADFLTTDATFIFGNAPAVHGREAIIAAVSEFFSTIKALRHELMLVIQQGSTLVCNGMVTYTRQDDTDVTLPFSDTFTLHNDKVQVYQIYMDIGPVYGTV